MPSPSMLALFIAAKAMVLSFRQERSSSRIQSFLNWQVSIIDELSFARLRQIVDGVGCEPSAEEGYQLELLVNIWERSANGN